MPEVTGYLEKYNGTKAPSSKRKNSFGFGTVKAGKWERRFFVLREGSQVLSIYKTPEDAASSAKPAQGTITAAGSMIIKDPMDETTFAISKDGKTTYLRAGHAGARSAWLEAIGTAGASVEEMPVAAAGGSGEMAGQLLKQGTGGLMGTKWDKRYLTLREGQLMVFKSESDASGKKPPLATMTLQGARIDVVGVGKSDDKVTFALSRGDKVHTLKAGCEADAARWVDALVSLGVTAAPGMRPEAATTAAGTAAAAAAKPAPAPEAKKKPAKKRMGVSAEAGGADDDLEEYVKRVFPKSEEARAFIMSCVSDSALFAGVTQQQRDDLVDAMQELTVSQGEMVINQGEEGNDFYVVRSGEYSVLLKQVGPTPVHTYHPGGMFGELALLYNQPRAASIQCKTPGSLYALDRATFRAVLRKGAQSATEKKVALLKRVVSLEGLTDMQLQALVSILVEEKYEDGQHVCEQGAPADSLYIVGEGLVHQVIKKNDGLLGSKSTELTPHAVGEFFGGPNLADERATWHGDVVAVGSVTLLRLKRDTMVGLLGDLTTLMRDNFQKNILGAIEMFQTLSASEVSILVEALSEQRFMEGDVIIRQGEPGETFYIVKQGEVKITKVADGASTDREIARLREGTYFGEVALLRDEPRMATVTAVAPTVCMSVDRTTFSQVLGPMTELIEREAKRRKDEAERLAQRPKHSMADFGKIGLLGVGTFGRVHLIEEKRTGECYALKCMRKKQLIALKQVEHVMNELTLLAACDHPFLINLVTSFQDKVEIYMVLELALGGELFSVLRDRVRFEEPMARFYAANVASAFVHLHDKHIAYRDLKPENLLLDAQGYLKICDFGFAKKVNGKTFTLCGTPEYLAPEIISNVGHNWAVDWWAVGILVYEMLTGDPPFVHDDPMQLYQMILRGNFLFPSLVGKHAKDLINKLLVANPAARLGSLKKGSRDVVSHPFFKLIDLTFLHKKQTKAPYVPPLKSNKDISNFDDVSEEDGAPLNPAWASPVSDEEQALFSGIP